MQLKSCTFSASNTNSKTSLDSFSPLSESFEPISTLIKGVEGGPSSKSYFIVFIVKVGDGLFKTFYGIKKYGS